VVYKKRGTLLSIMSLGLPISVEPYHFTVVFFRVLDDSFLVKTPQNLFNSVKIWQNIVEGIIDCRVL